MVGPIASLLENLRVRGVEFVVIDGHLRYRPVSAVTDGELAALRRHQAEVLRLLDATRDTAEVSRRVAAFRVQLDAWQSAGRFAVPFLAFPDVQSGPGLCVSCGAPLAAGRLWRCDRCEEAVRIALGLEAGRG